MQPGDCSLLTLVCEGDELSSEARQIWIRRSGGLSKAYRRYKHRYCDSATLVTFCRLNPDAAQYSGEITLPIPDGRDLSN